MTARKPVCLDTFSCASGTGKGYEMAGYEVYAIDNDPKPLQVNPFPSLCADAMECFATLLSGGSLTFSDGRVLTLADSDLIHASPPCQGYSIMNNLPWLRERVYPLLILPVRELLIATGKPYVIENVAGARFGAKGLIKRGLQEHGLKAGWLCGGMFGLPIYRHRYFETNFFWPMPGHPKHRRVIREGREIGSRARDVTFWPKPRGIWEQGYEEKLPGKSEQASKRPASHLPTVDTRKRPHLSERLPGTNGNIDKFAPGHTAGWRIAADAMGISWMRRAELTQAVPPMMTYWIAHHLMVELGYAKGPCRIDLQGRGLLTQGEQP